MGLFGGDSSSSSTSTSTAVQPTANADNASSAENLSLSGISANGKNGSVFVNVATLDGQVAETAINSGLASGVANVDRVLDFAGDNSALAFAALNDTREDIIGLLKSQAAEVQYAQIRAQDMASNIATKTLDLADTKTTSPDERLLGIVKIGLIAAAALFGAFILFSRPSKPAKPEKTS